jgi:hypothetical protein
MGMDILAMVIQKRKSVEPISEVQHFFFYKVEISYRISEQNFKMS